MDEHQGGPMLEGERKKYHLLDYALTMFLTTTGVPIALLDNLYTKNLFLVAVPGYNLPSATRFRDSMLPAETTRIEQKTMRILQQSSHLTASFDGLTTPVGGESIYTHHATLPDGNSFLLQAHNESGASHTAVFLHELFRKDMEAVGVDKFSAQCSDGAANVKLCREMTTEKYPWIINFSDPSHFLNLTAKELAKVDPINKAMKIAARITNHFSHATSNRHKLETLQADPRFKVTRGLESMGNTRFMTAYRCMRSVQRSLPPLQFAIERGVLDLKAAVTASVTNPQTKEVKKVQTNLNDYLDPASARCIEFLQQLNFAVAVLQPLHFALTMLEARATTPADVLLQWMHIARTFQAQFGHASPWKAQYPTACAEVLTRLNTQIEKGVYGPNDDSNVFRDAVYLHPEFHGTRLLQYNATQSNKIARSLTTLWRDHKLASVPQGHTIDGDAVADFRCQLQRYEHLQAPYTQRLHRGPNAESPLEWWTRLRKNYPETKELADIAIKLFSVKPSSLPEERWGSAMNWVMPGRRGAMQPSTLVQLLKCRTFFLFTQPGREKLHHFELTEEKVRKDVLPHCVPITGDVGHSPTARNQQSEGGPRGPADSVDAMFPHVEVIAPTHRDNQITHAAQLASLDHPYLAGLTARMREAEDPSQVTDEQEPEPARHQIDPRSLDLSHITMPSPPPAGPRPF
jgi:hypothetical protein